MDPMSMAAGGAMGAGLPPGLMPMLPQPRGQQPRPVPGAGPGPSDFYERLASGEPQAEATVRKLYTEIRRAALDGRESIEKGWWQKLLYVAGRQWIYYNPRSGWQDKRLAKWIPRPVTNICAETIDTLRAMTAEIDPSARVRPNGPDPMNAITAQTADDLEPAIKEEHNFVERMWEADYWTMTLGISWLHPFWDSESEGNKAFVQAMMCGECGYLAHPLDLEDDVIPGCPTCGTPNEEFLPAVNPQTKEPVGQLENLGKGGTEVVSGLELLIPMYFQRWEDVDRLIRLRWRPKSYYDGRPYANQIAYRATPGDRSLQMFRAMATMSDLATTNLTTVGQSSEGSSEGVIEAELWVKPCPDYPEGLFCRAVGGNNGTTFIIRDEDRGVVPGPLPCKDIHDVPLWTWVPYMYNRRGGRIFGPGALDAILTKQDAINRHDSMVELIMQRMANPIWLEPKGAEVQRFTGEPGLIVRYGVVAGSNAKPERLEGIVPSAPFFQLREQHFSDAERLAGTQDVLKGAKPGGVEAFSALNLLLEESRGRFTSLFKSRGRAYREWFLLAIELERVHGPQQRTRQTVGVNNTYTFKTFKKADLQGAINIVIEDGTETPKTALGKRAGLQQAKELGLVDAASPDVIYKGLELMGLTSMAPALDAHSKAAKVEHQKYEHWVAAKRQGPNPLKVTSAQNHLIHRVEFDIWANTDRIVEMRLNDPQVDAELTLHRLLHSIAEVNRFGIPTMDPGGMAAGGPGMPGAPPAGGAGGTQVPSPPGAPPPPGGPAPGDQPGAQGPIGQARAMANSSQESNAVDTLPGAAPGGGNMAPPA